MLAARKFTPRKFLNMKLTDHDNKRLNELISLHRPGTSLADVVRYAVDDSIEKRKDDG